ncbi:MAG TPA: DUF2938 domain-containing protein [Pirellulales bacterium]|nr:DUF2938 domain-containing protein [Pirellulales bacterium]
MTQIILSAIAIGIGATMCVDLWAMLLNRGFGIPSLDYCLLGRWFLHMPSGTFVHASIGAAQAKPHECVIGWVALYTIGVTLALVFVLLFSASWLENPTPIPALAFGIVTVLLPYFVMQPALGLGVAASKTPKPIQARVKSLMTHAVFGMGLYASAWLLSHFLAH